MRCLFRNLPSEGDGGLQIHRKEKGQNPEENIRAKSQKMKIQIDGHTIKTEEHKTILDAARDNDIFIPSLCDFQGLEPFTGCRLCIVEVSGKNGLS